MSFDAGAVVGTVLLDTSPVARAISSVMTNLGVLEKSGTSSFTSITPPASVAAGFGSAGSMIKGAAAMLSGWVVAAGAAVGVTVGLGAGVHAVADAMERIESAGKQAAVIGLSVESYTRLAHAAHMADVSQEGLATAAAMMANNLADAANNAGPAKDTMEQLGLSIDEIINLPFDQALGQIADKLNEVHNSSERLNLARNIFGKQAGPDFMALLAGGSAGIAAMAAESDKFGKTLSAIDAAQVQQANDALKTVGDVLEGVVLRAAVELAPYIEGLAKEFVGVATEGGGVARYVVPAVELVAQSVAYCADLVELFKGAWHVLKAGVLAFAVESLERIDELGRGLVKLINLIPGVSATWDREFSGMVAALRQQVSDELDAAGDAWNNFADGKTSQAVSRWFEDVKRQSLDAAQATAAAGDKSSTAFKGMGKASEQLKQVTDALGQLRQEVEQFGMSELQKKLAEFSANPAATKEQIAEYEQLLDTLRRKQGFTALDDLQKQIEQFNLTPLQKQLDDMRRSGLLDQDQLDQFGQMIGKLEALEAGKAIDDKVKAFRESLKSPAEQLAETTAQLDQWVADNRITQAERDKGVAEARKRLLGESSPQQGALPTFQAANSAQAVAARLDRVNGVGRRDVAGEQLTEQKTMVAVLREIRRALSTQDPVVEIVGGLG